MTFSGAKLLLFLWAMLFLTSINAQAGEPLFGYAYTTDLLPAQKWEIEQWFTDREGQVGGHFHHLDMATEFEYGVSDNFQVSMYLNYMYADESANSVRGVTEGIEIPYYHDPNEPYKQARFDGLSFEFTYRFLSPYLDPVGLAVYLEPELSPYESGLETRLILQKNFFEDQLVTAANIWVELDREQSSNLQVPGDDDAPDGSFANATYAELDLAATYRVASNLYVGVEFRNHNEYDGWTLNHAAQDHTAFFFGPNLHYGSEHFFATLAILKQIAATAYSDDQRAEMANGLLYGDEHTTWDGIRLILGFPM